MCGVRGSLPAPGFDFSGVGGHTSCVAIASAGQAPRLLLDAGTGIQNVTKLLDGRPFVGSILLTHLHWDHVWGLPFFRSGDTLGSRVTVVVPRPEGMNAAEAIDAMMSPPHFPIDRHGLNGEWRFEGLDEGYRDDSGMRVLCREIPHKGGRTFGFRVEFGGTSVAYLPDHSPCVMGEGADGFGAFHDAASDLARGSDLLIHGGQFVAEELGRATLYGHATIDYVVGLAKNADVARTLITHHSPARSDDAVAELEKRYASDTLTFAREGEHVTVQPRC